MSIRYVKHEAINRTKYCNCLQGAYNANAFAYPWYLDLVCYNWDLLVEGNYETVCPVPTMKWMGFTIVRQPPMTPFLGVFSSQQLTPGKVYEFMKAIPYRNVRLTLNHFNQSLFGKNPLVHRVPVLDLILPYDRLLQKYAPRARNILSLPGKCFVLRSIRTDEYMRFKQKVERSVPDNHMRLTRILNYALRYKSAGIYTVYSEVNELIGAVFLIKSNRRLFLMDAVENQEGKEHYAIFLAIDQLIKTNCESNLTLELPYGNNAITNMIAFEFHHCRQFRRGVV